jgi:hypothetical protein
MYPSVILRVLQAVAFELCQTGLLDGTTGCQLKNNYAVVQRESSSKPPFYLFRQSESTLLGSL